MAWTCGYCESELLWGGDNDLEDTFGPYVIVSNYTCPGCDAYVEIST